MSSTVEFWKEQFKNNDISIEDEIEDVKGTIQNEELWVKGSANSDEAAMHKQNIREQCEYLHWLETEATK